jgi:nucleoside phosphorylase
MIKILIADDKEIKRNVLHALLQNECNIPNEQIYEVSSINDARNLLCSNVYDLVILDLVMPNYSGEEPNKDDAPNFIDEIYSNPSIKMPNQIIGLTAYAEEFDSMKTRFEDKLWYLVHYEEGHVDWKGKIKNKVFHLIKSKKQIYQSIINRNKYDIGIVCALQEEYDQLLKAFGNKWEYKNIEEFPLPFKVCHITTSYGVELSICAIKVGKPGMVATSIVSTMICNTFHVDKIFMTGFAAGFHNSDLRLGDIVIAKNVQDYSAGKLVQDDRSAEYKLLREINVIQASEKLLSLASTIASDSACMSFIQKKMKGLNIYKGRDIIQATIAPSVCGPFVIASEKAIQTITNSSDRKLQSLDMEGFGLYMTAYYNKCDCLWIKGISDFADTKKGDDYHTHCAFASALFLFKMIKEMR